MKIDRRKSGQALIMVTLVLIPMFGLMGLAMDLGWAYYQQKTAQAAADAAALAAVRYAFARVKNGTYTCGTSGVECAPPNTPVNCPGTFGGSLAEACTAASNNGFTNSGQQTVNVLACVPTDGVACAAQAGCLVATPVSCIPTAPGVAAFYWVTVRISQQRTQLFSAVLGNTVGVSSARASAAVVGEGLDASITLLNQANDTLGGSGSGFPGNGVDLNIGGSSNIVVPGGVKLASTATNGPWASTINSNSKCDQTTGSGCAVKSSYTHIYNTGAPDKPDQFSPAYQNRGRLSDFEDPYGGLGQPPVTQTTQPDCPVLDGVLDGSKTPVILGPGNYYAVRNPTKQEVQGQPVATGAPLTIKGDVRFSATNSTTPVNLAFGVQGTSATCFVGNALSGASSSSFGNYFFWGGLDSGGGGTNSVVTVDPGRYVLAGPMNLTGNVGLTDGSAATGATGGPGELFILADSSYPGLNYQYQSISTLLNNVTKFTGYSSAGSNLQGGSGSQSINIHAIDPTNNVIKNMTGDDPNAVSNLTDYGALAIWQAQGNSYVNYDANGYPLGTKNNSTSGNSPQFHYQGSASSILYGVIYQPRGAWMWLQGGNLSAGQNKTQIITGALTIAGSSQINFGGVAIPPTIRVNALVE